MDCKYIKADTVLPYSSALLPYDYVIFFLQKDRQIFKVENAKSTKWWKLQFDSGYISYIPWPTNVTDMPVVHFDKIDVEQNH